ncbi:sporulation transcriptional regulator SpoIIID [Eubacterium multiforme]|uniref:DeoR family transcriptional regulator (Stage III sporulation protein D) n=1 Tax=Eubacterium multiforme TaxID=83339 RepID=A0ABT9USM8_9FIRM|nr:sporulation transcriptional regulator SpoIIID [Eubacterium multiforme]MDQ0149335.1 putative DeoR family transcriptional regulator (stage III sporulation protein D) [Eubacterium multiforme]
MNNRNKMRIESRALEVAQYIIETGSTVRATAKEFGVSKSTIYEDITKRILDINPILAKEAEKILEINKLERHLRGGAATKRKYFYSENLRTS